MRIAFKEWAVVVDALGRGEQILVLRKGGIREGRDGFTVEHPEFFLFPTQFHQQRKSVLPAAQARFDELAPHWPPPEHVRIEYFAHTVEWRRLEALSDAERLRGQHCWRDEVIAERFEWGHRKDIFALALRVSRLPLPVELPVSPAYAGCKSWIELENDLSLMGATAVLDEPTFDRKLREFHIALNPALTENV